MKKLSIITPLYKTRDHYLTEAMEPLQKCVGMIEWILINDSPDDPGLSRNLNKIYDPSYMVVAANEKNSGIFRSYYNGFMLASGEYCCILDHDDILYPQNILEAVAGGRPDIAYTDEYKFMDGEAGTKLDIYRKPDFDVLSSSFYFYTHHVTAMRTGIVKSVLRNKGADCGYSSLFDIHLMLEYLHYFVGKDLDAVHVDSADYGWRVHPDSTSMNLGQKTEGFFERLKKTEQFLKENGETPLVNLHSEIGYYVEGRFLSVFDELKLPLPVAKFKECIAGGMNFESGRYILWHNLGDDVKSICEGDWLFLRDLLFKTPLCYLRRQRAGTLFFPMPWQHGLIGGVNMERHIPDVPFIVKKERGNVISSGFKGLFIEDKQSRNEETVSCIIQKRS